MLLSLSWTDHSAISFTIPQFFNRSPPVYISPTPSRIDIREFSGYSPERFHEFYQAGLPLDYSLAPEPLLTAFSAKMLYALDCCAPVKTVHRKSQVKLLKKWFTPELTTLKTQARAHERRWRKS